MEVFNKKCILYISLICIKYIYDISTVVTFLLLDRCSSLQFGRRINHKNINLKVFFCINFQCNTEIINTDNKE